MVRCILFAVGNFWLWKKSNFRFFYVNKLYLLGK